MKNSTVLKINELVFVISRSDFSGVHWNMHVLYRNPISFPGFLLLEGDLLFHIQNYVQVPALKCLLSLSECVTAEPWGTNKFPCAKEELSLRQAWLNICDHKISSNAFQVENKNQTWSVQFSSVAQSCPTLCNPMNTRPL